MLLIHLIIFGSRLSWNQALSWAGRTLCLKPHMSTDLSLLPWCVQSAAPPAHPPGVCTPLALLQGLRVNPHICSSWASAGSTDPGLSNKATPPLYLCSTQSTRGSVLKGPGVASFLKHTLQLRTSCPWMRIRVTVQGSMLSHAHASESHTFSSLECKRPFSINSRIGDHTTEKKLFQRTSWHGSKNIWSFPRPRSLSCYSITKS